MIAERDIMDVYRTIYMQKHIGDEFEGRISGFAPFGIYVQVPDPFVSVLLPFEQLEDTYEPDDLGIRLIGIRTSKIFTMNDPVTVRIEDANVQARDVVGSLIGHQPAEAPTEPRRRRGSGPRKGADTRKHKSSASEARRSSPRKRGGASKDQAGSPKKGGGASKKRKRRSAQPEGESARKEQRSEPRKRARRTRRK